MRMLFLALAGLFYIFYFFRRTVVLIAVIIGLIGGGFFGGLGLGVLTYAMIMLLHYMIFIHVGLSFAMTGETNAEQSNRKDSNG